MEPAERTRGGLDGKVPVAVDAIDLLKENSLCASAALTLSTANSYFMYSSSSGTLLPLLPVFYSPTR